MSVDEEVESDDDLVSDEINTTKVEVKNYLAIQKMHDGAFEYDNQGEEGWIYICGFCDFESTNYAEGGFSSWGQARRAQTRTAWSP